MICFFDAVLGIALFFCRPVPLSVSAMDVGQGTASLISLNGAFILVDGGVDSGTAFEIEKMMGYRRRIDAVILSHPHADHYGGLESVIKSYNIGAFLYDGEPADSADLDRIIAEARKEAKVVPVSSGGSISFEGSRISILQAEGKKSDPNSNSLVIKADLPGFSALFPGDIGIEGESELIEKAGSILDSDILVAPHHGSAGSSGTPFIEAVSPKIAVFSVGINNRYGFPKEEAVERYAALGVPTMRTDESGTVMFSLNDASSLKIKRLNQALP